MDIRMQKYVVSTAAIGLAFKHYYRKNLVQILLSKLERGEDPKNFKVSILDAMHYTVKAWGEIEEITIKNCFRKAGIVKEQEDEIENTSDEILGGAGPETLAEDITEHNAIDGWKQISTKPLQNYMDLDINVMTSEVMDIDDIVDSHIHENLSDEELSGEEEVNLIHPIPTKEDAMRHIEGLKSYFTSIENVQDETFLSIYKIERAVNQHKNMYQIDLRD